MAIVVQKFGGSSVADASRMRRVAGRVAAEYDKGNQVAVIVSAMGDTTDDLIALAKQVTNSPSDREMDMFLSTGEQQSASLLAMTLAEMGYQALSLNGSQAGYHTDGRYAKAKILSIDSSRVKKELNDGKIVVITGFQGIDQNGNINTLGRGGSDTSAVAMAVALDADVCEIFTDVDGVYTADPRIVKTAQKMAEISYDEMLEMAAMGALVLQPRSVEMAKQYNIKLSVRSSFNLSEGTMVQEVAQMSKNMEQERIVCGVAHDTNVLKVTLFAVPDMPGIASKIFVGLAKLGVNIDMIIQSGNRNDCQDLSFTCGRDDQQKVSAFVAGLVDHGLAEDSKIEDNIAKISIVGAGMISNTGVAATMFAALAEIGCNIDMISTSEIKISCIIDETRVKDAVLKLHSEFNLDA